jgi:hypothetical protein
MIWLPRSEGFAVTVKSPVALASKSDGKATTSTSMIRTVDNLAFPIFMFYPHIVASWRCAPRLTPVSKTSLREQRDTSSETVLLRVF